MADDATPVENGTTLSQAAYGRRSPSRRFLKPPGALSSLRFWVWYSHWAGHIKLDKWDISIKKEDRNGYLRWKKVTEVIPLAKWLALQWDGLRHRLQRCTPHIPAFF